MPHEMTFEQKLVEQKFRGREETMTEHLVKLLAFEVQEQTRAVWRKEIRNHLIYLSRLRLRNKKPATEKLIWKWLYTDPMEGNEDGVVEGYIMMHEDDYRRNTKSIQVIAAEIKQFYLEASRSLSQGQPPLDATASL